MTKPENPLMGKLAEQIAQAHAAHAAHQLHEHREHRQSERLELLEILEDEALGAVRDQLGEHFASLNLEGREKELLDGILDPDHPVQFAALISILIRLAWDFGGAALIGPLSRVATVSLRNFGDRKPDPFYAADGAARHRITVDQAKAWMDDNGYTEVDIDKLVEIAQSTLPPGTALSLLQQGKIDGLRFAQILENNGLDGDSRMDFAKLRYQPPPFAVAINAVTQNQLSDEDAIVIMQENGVDPDNFHWIKETNGASPGVELLNKLKNYGLIDEDLWTAGILESPIKNKYVDALKNTRYHRPPMRTTLQMVHAGTITPEKGDEYLAFLGFFPEDRKVMIDAAVKQKTEGIKALTAANIRGMYVEGILDHGAAEARLSGLGYDATDVGLFLAYADAVRQRQRTNTALSHIRAQYLGHKIDETQTIGAVDRLGVPATLRDELIHDWEIEHEVTILHLSDSVIFKAGVAKLLTPDEVYRRLKAKGYTESDAHLLMDEHGIGHAETAKLKDLTVAQLLKLMGEERLPEATVKQRLMQKGYTNDDAQKLIDSKLGRNADGTTPGVA